MHVRHGQATHAPSQQQQKTLTKNHLPDPVDTVDESIPETGTTSSEETIAC